MFWVNLLWVLPLLTENVQAADNYLGNNRNWNLRRPALTTRPNPVVSPIQRIPKPLPEPVEVEHADAVPEIKEPVTLENKPTENDYDPLTARPNYRLLPRGRLLRPSRPESAAIAITTEPTTIEAIQTTSLYTNPPEVPSSEDIQVFKTNSRPYNPPPGRTLIPRPRPERIELNRPQPALESVITTTAASLPTVPIVESSPEPEEPLIVILPDSESTPIPPTTELKLNPQPEEPKFELLEIGEKEKPVPVTPEIVFETQPEKVEEPPKPEVIVLEEKEPEIAVESPRPLTSLVPIKRPELISHPYRVPKPVVSTPRQLGPNLVVTQPPSVKPPLHKVYEPKPLLKSPLSPNTAVSTPRQLVPNLVVTQPPSVKPPLQKVNEPKPLLKSPLPPNPGSEWTTPAPTQLYDYKCKEADGYYGIAGDCDNYVECKKNIAIMYSCPDGLHYNPRARWPEYPCAYPSEVKCESNSVRHLAHPTDECPQQYGFYSMSDSDCSRYIMCQEGKAFVMNCPVGLAFNAATSSCDWPENVPSCKPDVFRGFTCPAPPLEEDGSPSDMIFKYRYKESCKEYVACQRGHPRLLRCDPGMSFEEESQVCVDSDYVSNCKYY